MHYSQYVLIALLVVTVGCSTSSEQIQSNNTLVDAIVSGGPPKDGIPSIDDPTFVQADEAELDDGDIVIGVVNNGEAKAYPQHILVHHEIVNDKIGGENVAVTYCPLTGTALGFERGNTTFGVSGKLVNSNLIMYDRATDSYFPQILGTGIKGRKTGETIEQFRVVWTTWKEWKQKHPETAVLSEDTGFLRNYDRDPYGTYNPISGYYAQNNILFPLTNEDTRLEAKDLVIGYRNEQGAWAVEKDHLREERVVTFSNYSMIYDEELDTGRLYESTTITYENGEYLDGGERIQLEEKPVFDAFWFAWAAFYPDTELHA